eukprot:1722277-Rhodomonas_salina.1
MGSRVCVSASSLARDPGWTQAAAGRDSLPVSAASATPIACSLNRSLSSANEADRRRRARAVP